MAAAQEQLNVEAVQARTDALYRRHHRQVVRICRALLRDRAEAEDAAQQVFLSAHRALLHGVVPREPLPWLAAIARRECWARSARAANVAQTQPGRTDESVGDASVVALRNEEVAALWLAIAELPPAQREVLLLREIRGLSYLQLGSALALSAPATRSLLSRARRRVRLRLQDLHTAAGSVPLVETLARMIATGINPAAPVARVAALGLVAGGAFITPDALRHQVRRPALPLAASRSHLVRHVQRATTPATPPARPTTVVVTAAPVREISNPVRAPQPQRGRDAGAHAAAPAVAETPTAGEGSSSSSSSHEGRGSTDGGSTASSGSDGGAVATMPIVVPAQTTDDSGGAPVPNNLASDYGSHDSGRDGGASHGSDGGGGGGHDGWGGD